VWESSRWIYSACSVTVLHSACSVTVLVHLHDTPLLITNLSVKSWEVNPVFKCFSFFMHACQIIVYWSASLSSVLNPHHPQLPQGHLILLVDNNNPQGHFFMWLKTDKLQVQHSSFGHVMWMKHFAKHLLRHRNNLSALLGTCIVFLISNQERNQDCIKCSFICPVFLLIIYFFYIITFCINLLTWVNERNFV
jgi:hypothetical protein